VCNQNQIIQVYDGKKEILNSQFILFNLLENIDYQTSFNDKSHNPEYIDEVFQMKQFIDYQFVFD